MYVIFMETNLLNLSENQLYEKARYNTFGDNLRKIYTDDFIPSISFNEYIQLWSHIENNMNLPEKQYQMTGRVSSIRRSGKKLYFINFTSDGNTLQIFASLGNFVNDTFNTVLSFVNRGDIIGVNGFVGKTKTGELSIIATDIYLLSICYTLLPKQEIFDPQVINTQKSMSMICNPQIVKNIKVRSIVLKEMRRFLDEMDFTEVETPVLSDNCGGATAKPFITLLNDLNKELYMRIAPELYLKQLIIGGLNRVYEIGKVYRNESISVRHHPEFTSIEFYMAYSNYNHMMPLVEQMLENIVSLIFNTKNIKYQDKEINFTVPYNRVNVTEELQKITDTKFIFENESELNKQLDNLCTKYNIVCESPKTNTRLFDSLISHFLEAQCVNPTFLYNHPSFMSPLAKSHMDNQYISQRAELFINGIEVANLYTEQNMPNIQEDMFRQQLNDHNNGDPEAPLPDNKYIEAIKLGLPPTTGCGIGIDRLIMFLTNSSNIRNVISFPL